MSEEETSSSSTVDAVEEEVIEEVAEVPASAEDELLKAHEELKKKEGSVSLGKSLARAFRKDGMTKGDKKRAEEYAKQIKEAPAPDGTGEDETPAVEEGTTAPPTASVVEAPAKACSEEGGKGLLLRGTIVAVVVGSVLKVVFGGCPDKEDAADAADTKKKTFFSLSR